MAYGWNWSVLLQASGAGGTYLDWLLEGLRVTIMLGLVAWVLALVIGSLVGTLRTVPSRWMRGLATAYVEVFRNVPLLIQLFIWYFAAPELLPFGGWFKSLDPGAQQFLAATVGLGLYTGARVSEQVRAGINALRTGPRNAALALGMTLPQAYRYVILPVALRLVVPPLTGEFLSIFKNSAVASTIGLLELSAQGRQLVDYTAQPYESFIAVTLLYMAINFVVMLGMRRLERASRLPGMLGSK